MNTFSQRMRQAKLITSFCLSIVGLSLSLSGHSQPTISFTFDDGITSDRVGYAFEDWNTMILDALEKHDITAAFFVTGSNKGNKKGRYLLKTWDDRNHLIANHTYSHPNFNSDKIGIMQFEEELLGTDTIISKYRNYTKLFRFPYLKEGENPAEIEAIRSHMKSKGYRNGYVTIDASDWYVDSRLRKRLSTKPASDLASFKEFYLAHLFERASYYEKLSYEITGRHINHTLLLHHNLAAALFLDDLIEMFKSKGWNIVSADEAYADDIYNQAPKYAGESLIWALAKDSGKYEDQLRYPAEDGKYEKSKMDKLGL